MKKILLSTFTFMALATLSAQGDPNLAPGQMPPVAPAVATNPEFIQFKEVAFDFGNIRQGTPVSHIFEFKNVGNRDITLVNVSASCGCTTPNWKGGIYKPQETSQITATYNAASEGWFNKSVTVTTSEGVTVLTITGNVMTTNVYDAWKIKDDSTKMANKKAEEASKKGKTKKEGSKSKSEVKKKVGNGKGQGLENSGKKEDKKPATKTEKKSDDKKSKDKKPEDEKVKSDANKPKDNH